MIFYIVGLFLFVLFGYGYSQEKYQSVNMFSIVSLFLMFVFLFTFRNKMVGSDTETYISCYNHGYNNYYTTIEPLFKLLNESLKFLHLSYFSLFLIVSSTIFLFFFKSFDRRDMYILLPLLYIIVFVPSLNIQRQMLGLCFAFYGIKINSHKSILYFIIGFLFHKSIVFYLIIFIFSKVIHLNQKIYYIIGFVLLFLFITGKLLDILLLLLAYTPYAEYQWIVLSSSSVSVSAVTFFKIFLYYLFLFYTVSIENQNERSLYNILICCLIVGEMAAKMNPIFFRLQTLFSPVVLLGVQCVLEKIRKTSGLKHKVFLFILILYTFLTFFLNLKMGVNQIIPFDFVNCYEL